MYLVTHFGHSSLESTAVHSEKEAALVECRTYDETFSEADIRGLTEYGWIYEADNPSEETACILYDDDDEVDELYTLHIEYGEQCERSTSHRVYAGEKEDMIDVVMNWYDDEHNRPDSNSPDDKCAYCKKKSHKACARRFAKRFKAKGYGEMSSTHFATMRPVPLADKEAKRA